jgi:Transposase
MTPGQHASAGSIPVGSEMGPCRRRRFWGVTLRRLTRLLSWQDRSARRGGVVYACAVGRRDFMEPVQEAPITVLSVSPDRGADLSGASGRGAAVSSMTHHPAPVVDPEAATVRLVIAGVDTHSLTHHAAVLDGLGRELGDQQFPATAAGYTALVAWVRGHGRLVTVGIEGTGSYGAGLTRHLHTAGVSVVEIDRPDRRGPPGPG